MTVKVLVYGAGKIGRGFIGAKFAEAGHRVTFIDIDAALLAALSQAGGYTVRRVNAQGGMAQCDVTGVAVVNGRDEATVAQAIASCDLMATSLGARALELAAPCMAKGLAARTAPLNILICENLKDAPRKLADWLAAALGDRAGDVLARTGLVKTAIGTMVPDHTGERPEDVLVEDYAFLPADADALVAPLPQAQGLEAVSPIAYYEERKLYLHNMAHAVCAYLGQRAGIDALADAVRQPDIRRIVEGAMDECATMLACKYHLPKEEPLSHARELLARFENHALGDTCQRVARDPQRKLASDDRLIGAASACLAHGVFPANLCIGTAAALLCVAEDAAQAQAALAEHCGLREGPLCEAILTDYHALAAGEPLSMR